MTPQPSRPDPSVREDGKRSRDLTGDFAHHVVAVPVRKMAGIVAWRFSCSCGREGDGWHPTPEKAEAAGCCHIPDHFGSTYQHEDPT